MAEKHLVRVKPARCVLVICVGTLSTAFVLSPVINLLFEAVDLDISTHNCLVFDLYSEISISQHSTTQIKIGCAKHAAIKTRLGFINRLHSLDQLVYPLQSLFRSSPLCFVHLADPRTPHANAAYCANQDQVEGESQFLRLKLLANFFLASLLIVEIFEVEVVATLAYIAATVD